MPTSKIQRRLFYLILFLIPCNLAKHWPQDWSYVNGILIDYLIPTFYLTDVLILILLLTWFLESLSLKFKKQNVKLQFKVQNKKLLYCFIVSLLIITQLTARNWQAAIYKLIKLTEFGLLIAWIKSKRTDLKKVRPLQISLVLSVIWQSVLAITQWIKQGSIFGYWFFGEQPYTSATLGIKKISLLGTIKVLPMGTFPHPNVLAGFLVISLIIIVTFLYADRHIKKYTLRLRMVLRIIALGVGIIALFLTFSIPAWIVLIVFSIQYLVFRKRKNITPLLHCFITSLLLGGLGILGILRKIVSLEVSSWTRRISLNNIAFKMWLSSPVFGVGLNNFVPRMEEFGRVIANYRFLQPVHNIYLLVLSETGLVGLIGLTSLMGLIIKKLWEKRKEKYIASLLHCFIVILFLGSFDHYFLTIQQGMLLTAFILGLAIGR